MANSAQKKIKQTRGILILVVLACAAKLVKVIKDGNAQTAQIVVLAIIIVILAAVLLFYSWVDRYTQKEQENYGQPGSDAAADTSAPAPDSPKGLKGIYREIFKNDRKDT